MKQVVSAVAGNLPRQLKNFHLIKRQDIYIPFCEIGITCLTKEVTEINLFFETILKLIDIEVSDVYEISSIQTELYEAMKRYYASMQAVWNQFYLLRKITLYDFTQQCELTESLLKR